MALLSRNRDEGAALEEGAVAPDPRTLEEFSSICAAAARARQAADAIPEVIDTDEAASAAADALKALKHVRQDAEKYRKDLGRPYSDAKAAIDATFKEVASPVGAIEQSLKDRLIERERRRKAEAEERRRKEEMQAEAEQEQEDVQAAEEGRASKHIPPPAPKAEPTGARGLSGAKASTVEETKYEIIDEALLPDAYVKRVPMKSKIKADVQQGIVIPGVRPYKDDNVRVA